jgi:sulfoxide reductase heme-binding subunit YedZ
MKPSLHGQSARRDARRRAAPAALKPVVFVAALAPLVFDAWTVYEHQASHAYRALIDDTGTWTIWFVAFTLALTPLRRLTSWTWVASYRRMVGLFAFFYGSLHALIYLVLDRVAALDPSIDLVSAAAAGEVIASTIGDVVDKPFLLIGVLAFVAMIPLAVTSPGGIARRLGGRRWRRLHRLVYVVAIGGLLHHWWPLRDRFSVDRYGVLIAVLLVSRIVWVMSAWRQSRPPRNYPVLQLPSPSGREGTRADAPSALHSHAEVRLRVRSLPQ